MGISKKDYIDKILSDFKYLYNLCEKYNIDHELNYNICMKNLIRIVNYLSKTYDISKLYIDL